MLKWYLTICLLPIFVQLSIGSGYVPVVFLTNIRTEDCQPDVPIFPAEYILEFSESDYFKCLQKTKPTTIKLFVTDELDESDFSLSREKGGATKAFTHLQSTLASSTSVIMPAVQQSSVTTFLASTMQKSFKDADVSIIELPRVNRQSMEERRRSIAVLDEMIHEELLKISPDEQYIAVLTAMAAPQRTPRSSDDHYYGRQLLAIDDEEDVFNANGTEYIFQDDCIFIVYNNLTLTYGKEVWKLTTPTVISHTCATDEGNSSSIDLSFTAVNTTGNNTKNMTLSLSFFLKQSTVSLDYWWNISSAIVTHDLNTTANGSVEYPLKILDHYSFTAPGNWSWVCEEPDPMTWSGGDKESPTKQILQFKNLQLQPFLIVNGSFSRALDCSGFLTGPIWMGTVVSILLAIIFAFGFAGIAAITTMDRFDDPRGKTINVPIHESK